MMRSNCGANVLISLQASNSKVILAPHNEYLIEVKREIARN